MSIKILLITIFIILTSQLYSKSNSSDSLSQKEGIESCRTIKKPSIKFLSKKKGKVSILDESLELYFSTLQIREIIAFTGSVPPSKDITAARDFAREKFSSAVLGFSKEEKECISYVINKVNSILDEQGLKLLSNHPWKLIKIENWLCGGFAHTRGDYIILSQNYINFLTKSWSDEMTEADEKNLIGRLGGLLIHEQFHCLQRTHKEMFNPLYTDSWGFVKVEVKQEESITLNQVSNPDAPIPEWAFIVDGNYYWARTLLKEGVEIPKMGVDFIDVVFSLEKENNAFLLGKDENDDLIKAKLVDFKGYTNSFPVKRGLDHPNEISAYMFSDYFTSLLNQSKPFSDIDGKAQKNAMEFLKWIKKHLI